MRDMLTKTRFIVLAGAALLLLAVLCGGCHGPAQDTAGHVVQSYESQLATPFEETPFEETALTRWLSTSVTGRKFTHEAGDPSMIMSLPALEGEPLPPDGIPRLTAYCDRAVQIAEEAERRWRKTRKVVDWDDARVARLEAAALEHMLLKLRGDDPGSIEMLDLMLDLAEMHAERWLSGPAAAQSDKSQLAWPSEKTEEVPVSRWFSASATGRRFKREAGVPWLARVAPALRGEPLPPDAIPFLTAHCDRAAQIAEEAERRWGRTRKVVDWDDARVARLEAAQLEDITLGLRGGEPGLIDIFGFTRALSQVHAERWLSMDQVNQ